MTEINLNIHVNKSGELFLTPEKARLLKLINLTGSLLKASGEMDISYNKAWKMLEAMNLISGKPLVEKIRGGKGGGGATLSDYGNFILKEYEAIESVVVAFNKKLNMEINL
ncbi:MAG: winged helix-turn-helix domain-containing protein [Mangrovibacterium sp.]